jgi:hypothetical protein
VTSAAALAALGTGATMLIIQKAEAPSYAKDCANAPMMPDPDCPSREKLLGSTLWTGSIIGFSVGAGLTALSAVLFVLDAQHGNSNASSEHATFAGCTGHGTIGVSCGLRF